MDSPSAMNKLHSFLWTLKLNSFFSTVFTQPGLEKAPTYQVPQSEVFRVPKPGTVNWEGASQDHLNLVAETMNRLQQKVNQRRILCKPCFQDFDR